MTAENNYAIAIATLRICLKNLAPVFSTNEEQNQTQNQNLARAIFLAPWASWK